MDRDTELLLVILLMSIALLTMVVVMFAVAEWLGVPCHDGMVPWWVPVIPGPLWR